MESAPVNTPVKDQQVKNMPVKDATGKVDMVVQEYMDSLLGDLFPSIEPEPVVAPPVVSLSLNAEVRDAEPIIAEPIETKPSETKPAETKPAEICIAETKTIAVVEPENQLQSAALVIEETVNKTSAVPIVNTMTASEKIDAQSSVKLQEPEYVAEPLKPEINTFSQPHPAERVQVQQQETLNVKPTVVVETQTEVKQEPEPELEVEKRFPKAPNWAQQPFDVLLFDVCGLKLAVPMESLGRIIKVAHETNQLIGRPDWFIGAYNEADEHLYVVDTAKYIMPEKGYDLERDGFAFLIQLQKSKWTLACKNVHSTVRVEPDQVKWRSNQGKRQWLSGTVIEHMCALIHVDHLIDLLETNV